MRIREKALRCLLVPCIVLATLSTGMGGMVLCIDNQGHVAIEAAHEQHSHGADHECGDSGQPAVTIADDDDCGGECVDVMLSMEVVLDSQKSRCAAAALFTVFQPGPVVDMLSTTEAPGIPVARCVAEHVPSMSLILMAISVSRC